MERKGIWAYMGIIFVNIVWGLSFIASKYALASGFTPFTLALARFVLASAVLLPLTLLRQGRPGFTKREWGQMALSALLGTTLYFLFEYIGLQYTTASNASLIVAVLPVLTMALHMLLHKKRYPISCWLGAALSLLGVYLVVRYGGSESAENPLLGNLLMLCGVVCWALYIEVTQRLLLNHGSLKVTSYQSVIGALTLIPLALGEAGRWQPIAPGALLSLLFLGLICSALCYILYAQSISGLKPLRTALFINLNPLAAVIGGVLILGEQLVWPQLVGGALILVSIFYVNRRSAEAG